jgi:hypothetical protein
MRVRFAYVSEGDVGTAVFAAGQPDRSDRDRDRLLAELSQHARRAGLKVDRAALAYPDPFGWLTVYGPPAVVDRVARLGDIPWTHELVVEPEPTPSRP